MLGHFSRLPGGNISPSRFVILGTDGTVTQAGANGDVYGISQPSTRNQALTGWDDGYAGVANGPPINIFGPGDDECPLELSGTVNTGEAIKADTNGTGIKASVDHDRVGAKAVRGGVSGDIIPVKPVRYDISA
jgi:hypothetical protein